MSDSLQDILPIITGAAFILASLLFLIALRLFRKSRTDIYWRRRRDAGQRGWRLFVVGAVLLAFSGLSCAATVIVTAFLDEPDDKPVVTSVASNGQTPPPPAASPTGVEPNTNVSPEMLSAVPLTPVPSRDGTLETDTDSTPIVLIITSTPGATPTETPFPTFTPHVTPLVSSVTPNPDAEIRITALDDQISDAMTPVNPRASFPPGTTRIYMFVEFRNMTQGVLWKRMLYRDDELVDGNAYVWGLETDGIGYFFFGNNNGFTPGDYEIRLFIGESPTPISLSAFTVTEPS